MRIFLLILFLSHTTFAAEIIGVVTKVTDGDSLTITDASNKPHKVRLVNIDAPEKNQDYGVESTKSLESICIHKEAKITYEDKDKYNRILGHVYCNGAYANLEQVKLGMAWVYEKYTNDESFIAAQNKAKATKLGLWANQNPQAPWEFREAQKQPKVSSKPNCGSKTKCSQMSSCKEAMHYLNNCGVSSLDRDKDGIPCEKLCR
ncbi:MAG: hypothetical protein BGO27_02295 [Alphaproteobacteria bacterium 33-17]|nr:MAG: hypothetical protein BGO27_02295 [Alphaproteobacteria bacterium 33-17]